MMALKPLHLDASWDQVETYLEWLYESPYAYHLDDSIETIAWGPINGRPIKQSEIDILDRNNEIVWSFASDDSGTNLWAIYGMEEDDDTDEDMYLEQERRDFAEDQEDE